MPTYCDILPEVDFVPPMPEMTPYKPYFVIPAGCTSFEVFIKVESECYYIAANEPGFPSQGPCGDPADLQHVINLVKKGDCKSLAPAERILNVTLDYCEDPTGHKMNIYVVDQSENSKVKGESRSRGRLH